MGRSKALFLMQHLTGTSWPRGSQNLSPSITEQGVEGGCGAERYKLKNPHKEGLMWVWVLERAVWVQCGEGIG